MRQALAGRAARLYTAVYEASRRGPWRGLDDVEYAILEHVHWFNHRRLHGELGMHPPAEFEALQASQATPRLLAASP